MLLLSLPPYDLHALAWIAVVPFFLLVRRAGFLMASLGPLAAGVLFGTGHAWWIAKLEAVHPLGFWLGVLLHASYFSVFGLVARTFHGRLPRWDALTFPAVWVLVEYLRFHSGFVSFPWGVVGYSQYRVLPVAQLAAVGGVLGVSLLVVAVNAVVAEMIAARFAAFFRRDAVSAPPNAALGVGAVALLVLVVALLTGPSRPPDSLPPKAGSPAPLRVALIQSGVPSLRGGGSRGARETLASYHRLSLRMAESRPELILWPESAVVGTLPLSEQLLWGLSNLARRSEAFLLVGSSGWDKTTRDAGVSEAANSAFLLSPEGELLGQYDKVRLLPFNEYLPLRGSVYWPSWLRRAGPDARPGRELTIFEMDRARFGVQICWENNHPEGFRSLALRGVDFMVSMSNEADIESPSMRYQSLAMNVFRAIENHVSVVRITTNGVSALIEPSGRIAARIRDERGDDVNVEGTLVGEVPLSAERTFYSRHGDWLVAVLAAILVAAAAFACVRRIALREENEVR